MDHQHALTFAQAAKLLPKGTEGRRIHPTTIWRWARRGVRAADGTRIRLRITKIGGRNYVVLQELENFFRQLSRLPSKDNAHRGVERAEAPMPNHSAHTRAAEVLRQLGIKS